MPDARVIPIDGPERPRRGSPDAARDAVAAGAARATGERARRRRSSPLLDTGSPEAGVVPTGVAPGDPAAEARPGGPMPGAAGPGAAEQVPEWERKAAAVLAFVRRRLTGDYEVDEFGFDPELTDSVLLAAMRPLYRSYFRVETRGLENVPAEGGALIVGNHSGTVPVDSIMTQLALLDDHPAHRHLRMLGADLVFKTPVVSELARRTGTTLACNEDAERLLRKGALVGVWPEGFKGIGKPFSERYKLQRFGRGGFVSAALRTGTPIVPCSIVGAEEIYPIIGDLRTLARVLGLPYVPVTPTFPWLGPLGAIPLPSKWIIEFGEPIQTSTYGSAAADDPMLVFNLTDQVRETIQHTLYRLLMQRRSVFF
ncbi:MAG: hypothetical protein QOE01_959 [Actinomycetota bacterium]|nr:hypothetical protein [Actinomycetota bacterium]